ncbi:MAG: D-alanyl-D-alanine carboxypeptidase [Eggerthellaceae bacterium]|nr:D-alanyl-D-alanine carboxypeptidase [Eggerthellaceae bacterium]
MKKPLRKTAPHQVRSTARFSAVASASVALALCVAVPATAFADVRQDDQVAEKTVADRGLDDSQCPDIAAERVCVVGQDGTVYFQRNDSDTAPIASVTKVMTALVALENAPMDYTVTVSETAANIGESSANLQAGDTMTLEDALKALMIPSGNDAAQAIAESVGAQLADDPSNPENCTQAFVDAMNAKAVELGMEDTLFTNPHGLDDEGFESDQHSCAKDVSLMCAAAMKSEDFRAVVSGQFNSCTVTRDGAQESIELESTDELIGTYEGTCGIKTGFTDAAGGCFAGANNRDGQDLYAIVLGSTDEETRFSDTTELWDWVYANTIEFPLGNSEETVSDQAGKEVPLLAKVSCTSWIDKTVDATLADPEATLELFTLKGDVTQTVDFETLEGTVNAGDKVGSVTYKQDGETLATLDLVAAQTVEGPKWYESVGIWFKRLFRGITGEPSYAESVQVIEETISPLDALQPEKAGEEKADDTDTKDGDSKEDSPKADEDSDGKSQSKDSSDDQDAVEDDSAQNEKDASVSDSDSTLSENDTTTSS